MTPPTGGSAIQRASDAPLREVIGDFEVQTKLGAGGMGAVYRARQVSLGRMVALKVLPAHMIEDAESVSRFQREARVAASLSHANLVRVFSAGEADGVHYIAMELIEGEDLGRRLKRDGRLPASEALRICAEVARGLEHAWRSAHLIHRDIKPANIFLAADGAVKVGDLGLAKSVLGNTTGLTQTGTMMGTPHYISPEQARAEGEIDFRADIYSLGCTLYHLLTGDVPYAGTDAITIIRKHLDAPLPAILKVWPQCPVPLARLVGKMLKKSKHERHASYGELLAQIESVEALFAPAVSALESRLPPDPETPLFATPPSARPITAPLTPATPSPAAKSKLPFYCAIAALILVIALGGVFFLLPRTEKLTKAQLYAQERAAQPLLLLAAAPNPSPASVLQPDRATALVAKVFDGHRYQLLGEPMSWTAARAKATAMGGHLATITSVRESAFVRDQIVPALEFITEKPSSRRFFLGAFQTPNQPWKWVTQESFDPAFLPNPTVAATGSEERFIVWDFGGKRWVAVDAQWQAYPLIEWNDVSPLAAEPWQDMLADRSRFHGGRKVGKGNQETMSGQIHLAPPTARDGAMRARFVPGEAGSAKLLRGVGDGTTEVYEFVFAADGQSLVLYHRNAGARAQLGSWKLAQTPPLTDPRELEVRCVGGIFAIKVDGSAIASVPVADLPPGVFTFQADYSAQILAVEYLDLDAPAAPAPILPTASSSTASLAGAGATAESPWVSLLPLIDPQRDRVDGEWKMEGGELVAVSGGFARLALPGAVPEEYDFRIRFTRSVALNSVGQHLIHAGRQVVWNMGGFGNTVAGLELVGGAKGNANPTTRPFSPLVGHRYESLVKVRRDRIAVEIDGQPFMEHRTDGSDLSMNPKWAFPDPRRLGVGAQQPTIFHTIDLRPAPAATPAKDGPGGAAATGEWVDALAEWWAKPQAEKLLAREGTGARVVDPRGIYLNNGRSMRDVAVRLTVRELGGYGAIHLRYQREPKDDTHRHLQAVLQSNGATKLFLNLGQSGQLAGSPGVPGFDPKKSHTLEFSAQGDRLRVLLDGAEVASVQNWTLLEGQVFLTGTVGSLIEKLEYRELGNTSAAAPPVTVSSPSAAATKDAPFINSLGKVGATPAAATTIELLPLVELPRDVIAGPWTRTTDGLTLATAGTQPEGGPRIEFPFDAPEEYDLELDFTVRSEGRDVFAVLASGAVSFVWKMGKPESGATFFGFDRLDGIQLDKRTEAVVSRAAPLAVGRYTSNVEVRRGRLKGVIDGQPPVEWSGDVQRFQIYDREKPRTRGRLVIGAWNRDVTFHRATLRLVGSPAATAPPASSAAAPSTASKDAPFINSLGMKFVPVPITGGPTDGKRVLFSIWETRVQDYTVFAAETKRPWPKPNFEQQPAHPVVNVSWEDAQAFCAWLTAKERGERRLGANGEFRLPTDHEWSCAAGIGDRENAADSPGTKSARVAGKFPWGDAWPPPLGTENLRGEEWRAEIHPQAATDPALMHTRIIENYRDGWKHTAPVGLCAPNLLGLHDLGGNAREWCSDWADAPQQRHVMRGANWGTGAAVPRILFSSHRAGEISSAINGANGFRIVLAP
jgi:serine/threonine protein kinase